MPGHRDDIQLSGVRGHALIVPYRVVARQVGVHGVYRTPIGDRVTDPLATMAKVTSHRSEQRLDDEHELLPVLGGVPQQSGTDQDVVRAKLPELLSQDWDFGDSQVEWPRCPGQGTFHASDKLGLEQRADAALHGRAML